MILHPLSPQTSDDHDCQPVWDAILRAQKRPATEWLLITQDHHAMLAGEMARKMSSADFPALDDQVIQAIAVHDAGWKEIDDAVNPKINRQGLPLSFLEESPADIFRAWQGSIAAATRVAPIAGILVSEHFCRIARDFSRSSTTQPEIAQVLTTFVEREIAQQEDLQNQQSRNAKEISVLVDALQFFDLLSLYLCSGSKENVIFPQRLNQKTFRLYRDMDKCRLEPGMFSGPIRLTVKACKFSQSGTAQPANISVVVA